MAEIRPLHAVLAVVAVLAVGALGFQALDTGGGGAAPAGERARPGASGRVRVERAPARTVLVHVAGAVDRPGVYALKDGDRVEDAVRRAGGVARTADANGINLAAKVADGQQVVVPRRAVAPAVASSDASASASPSAAAPADGAASAAETAPAAPVGLNAATAEQLETLDGVGPATAEKIIAWRTAHGGFRSVDDLGQVPGIGPKRLAAMTPHVQP